MYSGKDLAELSGYTSRVYSLLASLHALDNNEYPKNPRPISLTANEVGFRSPPHASRFLTPSHSTILETFKVQLLSARVMSCLRAFRSLPRPVAQRGLNAGERSLSIAWISAWRRENTL